MSCNIISANHASINGSNTIYGGGIASVSYAPSTINGYNKATVKIVNATSSPGANNSANINIAGLSLNMRVGSYTETVGVGSVSSTTINYYDNSQILDNSHVLLKEEVPAGLGAIGKKFGPRPDLESLRQLGLIIPASDTVFADLRGYYGAIGAGNVDALVASAPGKTVYTMGEFMGAFGAALGPGVDFGVGDGVKVDFRGTLREVLVQMCNAFGAVAYWDPESDTVTTAPIGAPPPPIQPPSAGCTIITSSTTQDFTGSRAQGACGVFQSSNDGESFRSSGGKMKRFMKAKLLKPTLSIRVNGCGGGNMDLALFDDQGNVDPDIGKAMAVASNPKVYAMYALESGITFGQAPGVGVNIQYNGDNPVNNQNVQVGLAPAAGIGGQNAFLNSYYQCLLSDVFAVNLGGEAAKEAGNQKWNNNPGSSPHSIVGDYRNGTFERGCFLLVKKGIDNPIIGDDLNLAGEGDILRQYLQVLPNFINRMYVLKATGARSAVGGGQRYGYYITSRGSGEREFGEGWETKKVNPWSSIQDCGDQFIIDLARAMFSMHAGRVRCQAGGRGPLSEITVIDFINALENDTVAGLMGGGGGPQVQDDEGLDQVMYIGLRGSPPANPTDLAGITQECFRQNQISEVRTLAPAVRAAELIGQVSFEKDSGGELAGIAEKYGIGVLNTVTNVGPNVIPITNLGSNPKDTVKIDFDVEGVASSLSSGPGHVMLGAGQLPPGGAWKSKMDTNVSVNATDIAFANGIAQSYLASEYDEGFIYSKRNIALMSKLLQNKVSAHAWLDDVAGTSTTTTYLLEDNNMPPIPGVGEGLDSLSITNQGGKTELTITYGNAAAIRARATLRDMHATNSHLQHSQSFVIPNALNLAPNTNLENIANGQRP